MEHYGIVANEDVIGVEAGALIGEVMHISEHEYSLKPKIGMRLGMMEDGIKFYNNYTNANEFNAKKSTLKLVPDNSVYIRCVFCTSEGKKNPLAGDSIVKRNIGGQHVGPFFSLYLGPQVDQDEGKQLGTPSQYLKQLLIKERSRSACAEVATLWVTMIPWTV